MAPIMPRMAAFGLLLFGLPSTTLAIPTAIQPRQKVPGDTPFASFDACSDSQRQDIEKAWADVVTLAGVSKQFNPPGTIESRIFGDDINVRFEDISRIYSETLCLLVSSRKKSRANQSTAIFHNIEELNKNGRKMQISCQDVYQEHRAANDQVTCKNVIQSSSGSIGAYAFSTEPTIEKSTIVLCDPFWAPGQEFLGEIVDNLRKAPEDDRKNPNLMIGKGKILLHELTHLVALAEGSTNDPIVIDQLLNDDSNVKAYGIRMVERFARNKNWRLRTAKNADSYAWYATEKYFEGMFGTPNAAYEKRDGDEDDTSPEGPAPPAAPTKALNIILENKRHGVPNDKDFYDTINWLFYSTNYGTASQCALYPALATHADVPISTLSINALKDDYFPGGTYDVKTQDGDCQYKNDGTGNPGALWCGDQAHSCRAHPDRRTATNCRGLDPSAQIYHAAMVVCEW
ncbi:oviduct-specific glycoprotein [Fusarium denticulatum]|uniref:Oviduct-specific glycoprotein n=1 Tax=Fusarium denticulatum TaxID=48507 RepID=A0A8H5UKT9_9HYPO|nr:oviduct-specific glycoprotein [Fusarium denticulatum]